MIYEMFLVCNNDKHTLLSRVAVVAIDELNGSSNSTSHSIHSSGVEKERVFDKYVTGQVGLNLQ